MSYKDIWKAQWKAQGGRCFACALPVALKDTAKRAMSFEILCKSCYKNVDAIVIVYDEFFDMEEYKQ